MMNDLYGNIIGGELDYIPSRGEIEEWLYAAYQAGLRGEEF
jgi:hypothetical protein